MPIPFLDAEGRTGQFGIAIPYNPTDGHFSIFMLGIMPYVSAYILVEIFSLCLPPLKRMRSGNFEGRLKLKRIALVLALALAIFQSNSLVSSLKSWNLSNGKSILNVSNAFEHLILVGVMVGSFYLLVALCELITKFGIGGFNFYQKNIHKPLKIAGFHDIYNADMIQNHLAAVGIKSYLRGYHHRLLNYFFGPYLEISLIIDDQDRVKTQTIIQDYYDGLGLCRTAA